MHLIGAKVAQNAINFCHHTRNVFTVSIIYGIKTLVCSWIVNVDPAKITRTGRNAAERTEQQTGSGTDEQATPGTIGTESWRV